MECKKIIQIAPFIAKSIEYRGPTNKIGSFIRLFIEELQKSVFLKVTGYITPIKKMDISFRSYRL